MAEMDGAIGQAAGTRKLDVIGAQDFQHFSPHQAHDERELKDRQGDCGKRDVVPALGAQQAGAPPAHLRHGAPTKAGEPAQGDGKHQDQQNADQKGGQGDPQKGEGHEHLAHESAALERRIHAHGHSDQEGQEGGHQGQFQGGREALGNESGHLGALAQAQAKLALCGVDEEVSELNEERLIQPQLRTQFPNLLGRGVLSEQENHGIPHILEQHEGDEGHRDHDDHCLDQAAQDKS